MLKKGFAKDFLIFMGSLADDLEMLTYKGQMKFLLSWGFSGNKRTYEQTVRRLLTVGDINKVNKNGQVFLELTSRGRKELQELVPFSRFSEKPWDKKWRIVIFDIQEINKVARETLRSKLLSLGFGCWQKSVYITPFNIENEMDEYLISKKLFPSTVCLVAKRTGAGDDKNFASEVWKLDKINEKYENFIFECDNLLDEKKPNLEEIRRLWTEYRELILSDPCLPIELLPYNWLASEAREKFLEICRKVSSRTKEKWKKEMEATEDD